ncbi:MAG TPA: hypothetical protein VNG71_20115 [Pyrinomonadaceae bacterium]|nr:hypothetical protein [Pyrinomonadaceae bacterium]
MKIFLGFALLTFAIGQSPTTSQDSHGLEMARLEVKDKILMIGGTPDGPDLPDAVTRPDPNLGRPTNRAESENARIERQTNQRIQNMHAIENAKLESPREPKMIPLYESRVEVKNSSGKIIVGFVFAYRASKTTQFTADQEILCKVTIKPDEIKKVTALSYAPYVKVVDASSTNNGRPSKPTLDDVIINRVEFADGTTWQRRNWNPMRMLSPAFKAIAKGRCGEI